MLHDMRCTPLKKYGKCAKIKKHTLSLVMLKLQTAHAAKQSSGSKTWAGAIKQTSTINNVKRESSASRVVDGQRHCLYE